MKVGDIERVQALIDDPERKTPASSGLLYRVCEAKSALCILCTPGLGRANGRQQEPRYIFGRLSQSQQVQRSAFASQESKWQDPREQGVSTVSQSRTSRDRRRAFPKRLLHCRRVLARTGSSEDWPAGSIFAAEPAVEWTGLDVSTTSILCSVYALVW